jgi:hypothetical protein
MVTRLSLRRGLPVAVQYLSPWLFGILAIVLLVWVVNGSQSFQDCINSSENQAGEQTFQKRISDFSISYRDCLGAHERSCDHSALDTRHCYVHVGSVGIHS